MTSEKKFMKWKSKFKRFFESSSLERLRTSLIVFEKELDSLKKVNSSPTEISLNIDWKTPSIGLLEEAKQAVNESDVEKGWRCLKAADRFLHFGLAEKTPDLLKTKEKSYLIEAKDEKKGLSKWRKDSIIKLLDRNVNPEVSNKDIKEDENKLIHVYRVIEAKRLLDEHFDNVYQKQLIIKRRLIWLSFFGLIAIVFWIMLSLPVPAIETEGNDPFENVFTNSSPKFWFAIVLAGILGSILSSFTSSIGNEKGSSIPAELSTNTLAFARIMVGALSAIVITVFLTADILSFQPNNYAFMLTMAIISGFSDRFLLNAIEKMVKS